MMKINLSLALLCAAPFMARAGAVQWDQAPQSGKVTVYRLEVHTGDDGGNEFACIVGGDGISRPVMLVDPEQYAALTGRVEQVWHSLNSTRDGRLRLHGKIVQTEMLEDPLQKVEVHADGFVYREPLAKREPPARPPKTALQSRIEKSSNRPYNISARHAEMRAKLAERESAPPKTVTIEHDAASGKDTVHQ